MSTLVLACEERSALACVRSLRRRTDALVLASPGRLAQALFSRSARGLPRERYPDPLQDTAGYVAAVREICTRHRVRTIFPMTEPTLLPLLAPRETLFGDVAIPIPGADAFLKSLHKRDLLELARGYGVGVPEVWPLARAAEIPEQAFPVFLKAFHSVALVDGALVKYRNRWIPAKRDLPTPAEAERLGETHFVESYVRGHGGAVYFLFWRGSYVAHLEQITLAQQVGPGSVVRAVAVAGAYPETVPRLRRLLEDLSWHGVAMLEVRRGLDDGVVRLIECNPRFWGPTQLSVDAGVDFPGLLYALTAGGDPASASPALREPVGYTWQIGAAISRIEQALGKRDPVAPVLHNAAETHVAGARFRDLHLRREDPLPAAVDFLKTVAVPVARGAAKRLGLISPPRPR